jgi:phage shock protein A
LAFFFFRTATKVSEMLGNVNTSSALSAFEKMEEKGTSSLQILSY